MDEPPLREGVIEEARRARIRATLTECAAALDTTRQRYALAVTEYDRGMVNGVVTGVVMSLVAGGLSVAFLWR